MSIEKKPIKVVKLIDPIVMGDAPAVTEVVFYRKFKGKDLRSMPSEPDISDMMDMLSTITALDPFYFDEMGVEDLFNCVEVLTSFLPSSLVAGLPNLG